MSVKNPIYTNEEKAYTLLQKLHQLEKEIQEISTKKASEEDLGNVKTSGTFGTSFNIPIAIDSEGKIWSKYIEPSYPVSSVNGKVGEVVLKSEDIKITTDTTDTKTIQSELNRIDENADRIEGRFEDTETYTDIIEGSKYISFDLNEDEDKLVISLDQTSLDDLFATEQEVVADLDEDNKIQLNLNNGLSNKINNSLQIPLTTPSTTELVGVDTSKDQARITIGSGLSLSNNILSATGAEFHLYKHKVAINYYSGDLKIIIEILNTSNTPFNTNTIKSYIQNTGIVKCITDSLILTTMAYNPFQIKYENGIFYSFYYSFSEYIIINKQSLAENFFNNITDNIETII